MTKNVNQISSYLYWICVTMLLVIWLLCYDDPNTTYKLENDHDKIATINFSTKKNHNKCKNKSHLESSQYR